MPSKFDFISPDILLREVDESQVPNEVTDDGALIVGQALMGPSMQPVRVKNLDDLYTVFGRPQSGKNDKDDLWRSGNTKLPTYGLYAAQAWLSTQTSPVTFVRLAGEDATNQDAGTYTFAGWSTGEALNKTAALTSAAYGLFIMPSASAGKTTAGTLAAVIYTKTAAVSLSGSIATTGATATTSSVGVLMVGNDAEMGAFTLEIADGSTTQKIPVHLNPDNKNGFIRNALNTNPQLINSINQAKSEKYFLGETYETEVFEKLNSVGSASAGKQFGILLPLSKNSFTDANLANHYREATTSKTGWFIARDPSPKELPASFDSTTMKKLFRLNSLHAGEKFQRSYAVRISDLKLGTVTNPDSTFTVSIIGISGEVEENYTECTLNENSAEFIGKKIGDTYQSWNTTQEKYITLGNYPNRSNLVYVEMDSDWKAGIDDKYTLPFGFYGPAKLNDFSITSGSVDLFSGTAANVYVSSPKVASVFNGFAAPTSQFAQFFHDTTASISFPELQLTTSGSKNGGHYNYNDTFGVRHFKSTDQAVSRVWKQADYIDLVRPLSDEQDVFDSAGSDVINSFIFTLDEIVWDETNNKYYYKAGSHADSTALTAKSGSAYLISTKNVKQFQAPFFGGTDGVDITLTDPFSSKSGQALTNSTTENTHYAHYSVQKVLDIISDEEVVQYDVASVPGLTINSLRRNLINNTEDRGDALAIIDVDSGFKAEHENSGVYVNGSASAAIADANTQDYNSSYAATYYPPVVLAGEDMGLRVPASVAGIGVLAQSDAASGAPWFAPAGFNRGGISQLGGNQGPRVQRPVENLNKADRDDLYQVNINPIANFPGEGPVVFGQKTLQQTPSALDRINVRRLMIYLKKRIGEVARTVLFDQNVNATWNRFKAGADPILSDARSRFGVSEYKLILDETTTTPDYQDRNIMYAKVFIKPAKAIEFIAIDFTITRSGIEF
tara:strand:+ start:964 stop:3825 length:2862 start_codon:yes stop_codon:yes gene_type:complete